ncbi:MAG: lasso RiPP family leader peptide-containing protein [Anaerolineae bacterium]
MTKKSAVADSSPHHSAPPRAPYAPPRLTRFGDVRELTLAQNPSPRPDQFGFPFATGSTLFEYESQ